MLKSALHDIYLEKNADLIEVFGWNLPKLFTSVEEEVKSARSDVGLVDISNRGKLILSGKEHIKFLQGMLSNDVSSLNTSEGNYATTLTVKGKMISDMRVFKESESVYIDLEPGLNDKLRDHLVKFRLSYKADIDDITNLYSLFHLFGPCVTEKISKVFSNKIESMLENSFLICNIDNIEIKIFKVNRTGETGYDFLIKNDKGSQFWELINSFKPNLIGLDSLETLRIEAGIPIYGKDMDESTIPIEAGLWNALDFEKGCYIGQEVIARIKWRGRVNWHLVGIESKESQLMVGSKIYIDDKEVGRITSSTYSPTCEKYLSLGYIRREYKDVGTYLKISDSRSNNYIDASVVDIPFYNNFN